MKRSFPEFQAFSRISEVVIFPRCIFRDCSWRLYNSLSFLKVLHRGEKVTWKTRVEILNNSDFSEDWEVTSGYFWPKQMLARYNQSLLPVPGFKVGNRDSLLGKSLPCMNLTWFQSPVTLMITWVCQDWSLSAEKERRKPWAPPIFPSPAKKKKVVLHSVGWRFQALILRYAWCILL